MSETPFTFGEAESEAGAVAVTDPSWRPYRASVVEPLPPVCPR